MFSARTIGNSELTITCAHARQPVCCVRIIQLRSKNENSPKTARNERCILHGIHTYIYISVTAFFFAIGADRKHAV